MSKIGNFLEHLAAIIYEYMDNVGDCVYATDENEKIILHMNDGAVYKLSLEKIDSDE